MKLVSQKILPVHFFMPFFASFSTRKKCLPALLGTAFTAVLIAMTIFASPSARGDAKTLNIYSSRHYEIDTEINKRFSAATGIAVNQVQVKEAGQLLERLKSEGPRSPADILLTVDVGNLWRATEADLLQPLENKELNAAIPLNLREPNGKWFAFTSRARVVAYNKAKVPKPNVTSYEDLANPALKGKVLVRSSTHVYNQSLLASIVFSKGSEFAEQWARGIAHNLARKPEGGDTDQIKALAAGLGEYAIVNSYYVARLLKSNDAADKKTMAQVGVIFPNQNDRGTHINISGGGVTKHAPNKENAIKYLQFLASAEIQKLLSDANNEYPARVGVALDSVVQSFGNPKFDTVSLAEVGPKTPEAVKILDRVGWK